MTATPAHPGGTSVPATDVPVADIGARGLLPVATREQVRRHARHLAGGHRRALSVVLVLYSLGALAGLAGPAVLGHMVNGVLDGTTDRALDHAALLFGAALIAQSVLTGAAMSYAAVVGQSVLATMRENFLYRVLRLPLAVVERADTGDLLARSSSDISLLQDDVRRAVPEIGTAFIQAAFLIVALIVTSPLLALTMIVGLVPLTVATRWYRRRAPQAYQRLLAAEARTAGRITETADAGRSVESLRLGAERVQHADADVSEYVRAELATLRLRTFWFPSCEFSYVLPLAAVVALGGVLVHAGSVSVGTVTAATLYIRQLINPVDAVVSWMDELAMGGAAMARLIGVNQVADPPVDETVPADDALLARDVHFSYRSGREVLHGLSLTVPPGGRVAVVGPSGAGKSTLARLLAGIAAPSAGEVTYGQVAVAEMPPEELRRHIVLVTQEQHVFVGTIRDNLVLADPLATDDELTAALATVDAQDWIASLPAGLDTVVGSGAHPLSPGQAQQLALARLVLADPGTLVLDEATAMLDAGAARDLERALAGALEGRTVVAIAHRLSTAFDADLVAVVEAGEITELGTHEQLLGADGAYAALWRSWQTGASATR